MSMCSLKGQCHEKILEHIIHPFAIRCPQRKNKNLLKKILLLLPRRLTLPHGYKYYKNNIKFSCNIDKNYSIILSVFKIKIAIFIIINICSLDFVTYIFSSALKRHFRATGLCNIQYMNCSFADPDPGMKRLTIIHLHIL